MSVDEIAASGVRDKLNKDSANLNRGGRNGAEICT